MSVGFLITFPYQIYHYKWIAAHLPAATALLEVRGRDHGLSETFVGEHLPGVNLEWVAYHRLPHLDGRFDAVVCQTPIRPLTLLEKTFVIAQQYSLAKERYQYGVWRSHAHLNLMYGAYSVEKVGGFSHAVAVGNPLLDPYHQRPPAARAPIGTPGHRTRLLYLPTHSWLSSLNSLLPRLRGIDAEVTVKLHHTESYARATASSVARPRQLRVVSPDTDPVALLREHDGVISDVSGAAYDALYAGLPVVLTPPPPASPSHEHLSLEEWDHSSLAGVTATWWTGADLLTAFANAAAKLDSPAYRAFVAARFANPGTAGAAAAREICRLLDEGEPYHFGARQVREATRRSLAAGGRMSTGGRPGTRTAADPDGAGRTRTDFAMACRKLRWRLVGVRPMYRAVLYLHRRWREARCPQGGPADSGR